jgi:hypothetical protein
MKMTVPPPATIQGMSTDRRALHIDEICVDVNTQVRKTPSWPRSWANFSPS